MISRFALVTLELIVIRLTEVNVSVASQFVITQNVTFITSNTVVVNVPRVTPFGNRNSVMTFRVFGEVVREIQIVEGGLTLSVSNVEEGISVIDLEVLECVYLI